MDERTPQEEARPSAPSNAGATDAAETKRSQEGAVRKAEEAPPRRRDRADDKGRPASESDKRESKDRGEQKPGFIRRHPVLTAAAIILLIAAGAGFFLWWWLYASHYESTDDAFIDARQFAISSKVSGYIVDVPVTDNQFVHAGELIAQIDPRDYQNALAQAEAQRKGAADQISAIEAQISAQQAQIDQAQQQVAQTQAALVFAQQQDQRAEQLAQTGAGTVQAAQQTHSQLLQAQANVNAAQSAVAAARTQIAVLRAQRANAVATQSQAKAARDQAQLNLEYASIKAAQGGRIARLTGAKGEYVTPGQNISMFVPDPLWVTANFKETQITDMRPGQPVDIEIDAYPNRALHGHVESIQPGSGTVFSLLPPENATGNYVKVVQRVPVKIVFDSLPTDITLGPGMSVVPTVRVR